MEDATTEESSSDPQPHPVPHTQEPARRTTTKPAPPFNVDCTEIYNDNLLLSWDHTDESIMDKFIVEARDMDSSEWKRVAETENGMMCSIKVNDY